MADLQINQPAPPELATNCGLGTIFVTFRHPREPMGMFGIRRPENFSALFCAYDCGGQSRGNFSFDDIDERATTNG